MNTEQMSVGDVKRGKVWEFVPLEIPDVILIDTPLFADDRGGFSETYNARVFKENGIDDDFVQDNSSISAKIGTIRGLHFQKPPFAQAKLVRALSGSVLDVAVDMRTGSSTFGQHVSAVLSAENGRQLYVPVGFAHGFATLEPLTQVAYKVSNFYAPAHDSGILWSDERLSIDWGFSSQDVVLSEKDAKLPTFSEMASPF